MKLGSIYLQPHNPTSSHSTCPQSQPPANKGLALHVLIPLSSPGDVPHADAHVKQRFSKIWSWSGKSSICLGQALRLFLETKAQWAIDPPAPARFSSSEKLRKTSLPPTELPPSLCPHPPFPSQDRRDGRVPPRGPAPLFHNEKPLLEDLRLPLCGFSRYHLLNLGRLFSSLFKKTFCPPLNLFISPRLIPCQCNDLVIMNKIKIRA